YRLKLSEVHTHIYRRTIRHTHTRLHPHTHNKQHNKQQSQQQQQQQPHKMYNTQNVLTQVEYSVKGKALAKYQEFLLQDHLKSDPNGECERDRIREGDLERATSFERDLHKQFYTHTFTHTQCVGARSPSATPRCLAIAKCL